MTRYRPLVCFLAAVSAATMWSAIHPADCGTRAFEISIGLAGAMAPAATYSRFQFSNPIYPPTVIHFSIGAAQRGYGRFLFDYLRGDGALSPLEARRRAAE